MTGRVRIILTAIAVAVVLLLAFFFGIRPQQNELAELDAQIEQEENRTQQLEAELARLQELKANAPQLQARLERVRELVPQENQVPNFIFQVQAAADTAGVGFLQITPQLPKTPPEGAQVAEVVIQMRAKGGYFAVQDFIRRLYKLDRALRLDNVTMSGSEDPQTGETEVDMTGTIRIFFELPVAAPAPGTTTPAPSPSPTP
jgi:Tfp pilus assembly protein PilO